jgi:hypothetical protein
MPVAKSKECEVEKARSHYPVLPEVTMSAKEHKVVMRDKHSSCRLKFVIGDVCFAAYAVNYFKCSIIAIQILYRFCPAVFVEPSDPVPAVIPPEKNTASVAGIVRPFGIVSVAASLKESAASVASTVRPFGIAATATLLE